MGADTPNHMEYQPQAGVSVSLSGDDEPRLRGYFERLGEGGIVAMPFEKAPWGDTFGMVRGQVRHELAGERRRAVSLFGQMVALA